MPTFKKTVSFPVISDCSVDEPIVLLSGKAILKLYNQDNGTNWAVVHPVGHANATEEKNLSVVRDWFVDKAKSNGWVSVKFTGTQAILNAFPDDDVEEQGTVSVPKADVIQSVSEKPSSDVVGRRNSSGSNVKMTFAELEKNNRLRRQL